MPYYFWMMTWWRKRTIFKKQKFSLRVLDAACFFPSLVLLIKKRVVPSRCNHRRSSKKMGVIKKIWKIHSLFFNEVAEHLWTTASVIPSFQYTLFISHFMFYFSLEYLWSHGLSVWKLPSTCLLNLIFKWFVSTLSWVRID